MSSLCISAFCFLFILTSTVSNAQTARPGSHSGRNAHPELLWASGGLGFMGEGAALVGRLTYAWDYSLISAQTSYSAPLSFGGGSGGTDVAEFGLYYGRMKYSEGTIGKVSAGLTYLYGSYDYGKHIRTLGLGLNAEIIFKISPVGIGLLGSVLISPKYIGAGVTLNLHLGKLD